MDLASSLDMDVIHGRQPLPTATQIPGIIFPLVHRALHSFLIDSHRRGHQTSHRAFKAGPSTLHLSARQESVAPTIFFLPIHPVPTNTLL